MIDRRGVLAGGMLAAAMLRVPALARGGQDHRDRIAALIAQMTLAEKLGQMTQIPGGRQKALNSRLDGPMLDRVRRGEVGSFLHVAGAEALRALQKVAVTESRLKIPILFAMDVIHGYRTILPVPLALAASWDPDLMRDTARLAAEEAWAAGLHWTFAPMVDVARDARWGRVVEGAGEDPYLGSRMAVAQVQGFEGDSLSGGKRVMSCVKHFAGYGAAAGGRDYDSADISDRTLHEVYLPPFHAAAKAGAGSFMTAFNDIGGIPMTAHEPLIRGELRGSWGYDGLIVSDWNAIRELINHGVAETPAQAAALALKAGIDMDMAGSVYAEALGDAVKADPALLPLVDQAVERILMAKHRLGLFDNPFGFGDPATDGKILPAARALARKAAQRSIVLLRNDGNLLPLKPGRNIALIGALADDASSTLGSWRARGQAEDAVTLRRALQGSGASVEYQPGVSVREDSLAGIPAAVAAAKRADVVLLAIGEDYDHSGEARSRADIGLPGAQMALVKAIRETGKPVVAILMNGRPLALEEALTGIPAVLETWFLGLESGPAILDVLTGKVSPGGKLPMGMPRNGGQAPMTYAHLPTGRPANADLAVDSARYRDVAIGPLYPFGHGLSYASFDYSALTLSKPTLDIRGTTQVSVTVTNRGTVSADEVVQLYVRAPARGVARPVKELRGFARITLAPGQSRRVTFSLNAEQVGVWLDGNWRLFAGKVELMVGSSSDDIRARGQLTVTGNYEYRSHAAPAAAIETKTEIA